MIGSGSMGLSNWQTARSLEQLQVLHDPSPSRHSSNRPGLWLSGSLSPTGPGAARHSVCPAALCSKDRVVGRTRRFLPSGWVALRVLANDSAIISPQTPLDPICPPTRMGERSQMLWREEVQKQQALVSGWHLGEDGAVLGCCFQFLEPPSRPSPSPQPSGPLVSGLRSATCWLLSACPNRGLDPHSVCPPCLRLPQYSACGCPGAFPLSSPRSLGWPSIPQVALSVFLPHTP